MVEIFANVWSDAYVLVIDACTLPLGLVMGSRDPPLGSFSHLGRWLMLCMILDRAEPPCKLLFQLHLLKLQNYQYRCREDLTGCVVRWCVPSSHPHLEEAGLLVKETPF